MKLTSELFNRIVSLLAPHLSKEADRRALLIPAFRQHEGLYRQIDWSGDARAFTVQLVELCLNYGEVVPGKPALAALLEALQQQVGADKQQEIDLLLVQLRQGEPKRISPQPSQEENDLDINQLTEALLACPGISNRATRDDIVSELPEDMRNNISRRDSAKADVRNIIKTCQNYEGGLEKLIEILRAYEGNSLPMQEVERLLGLSAAAPEVREAHPGEASVEKEVFEDFAALKEKSLRRNYLCLMAVQNYQHIPRLHYPISDAEKLRDTLTARYTFDPAKILFLKDPTRDEIFQQLAELERKVGKEDNLLLFFAGHGQWDEPRRQGYWLPKDARPDNKASWISNSDVADQLRSFQARHILLVSDACFSGAIFQARGGEDFMKTAIPRLSCLPSRRAMTSGVKEKVPDYSVFLEYLVRRLAENEKAALRAGELFVSLEEAVLSNSGTNPQYGAIHNTGHEGGDFVFFRK